ncbi:MAG: DoxX family protein [Acidobacteriaceae bacterium]
MSELKIAYEKACGLGNTAATLLQPIFLLGVRLYWGWQFAQSGWGKLHNLEQVTGFFASLGIPFPSANAHMNALTEFIGGLLFAIGLLSRPVSLILAVTMTVAYWTADREALFSIFSDPGKFYNADPYTFLFAALLIVLFGPGRITVDTVICRLVSSGGNSLGTRR